MPSALLAAPRSPDHHLASAGSTALVDACPVCRTSSPAEEALVACRLKLETATIPLLRFRCVADGCGYLWAQPSQRAINNRTLRAARS